MDYPKLANCSNTDVVKLLRKLGGFTVNNSAKKHIKITNSATQKSWMLPRSKPLKRGLVWDFVRSYLQQDLGYKEENIFKYFWC